MFRQSAPTPFAVLLAKDLKTNQFVKFATTVRTLHSFFSFHQLSQKLLKYILE